MLPFPVRVGSFAITSVVASVVDSRSIGALVLDRPFELKGRVVDHVHRIEDGRRIGGGADQRARAADRRRDIAQEIARLNGPAIELDQAGAAERRRICLDGVASHRVLAGSARSLVDQRTDLEVAGLGLQHPAVGERSSAD